MGRPLSVAVGNGATALAQAARQAGTIYTARIPAALVKGLEISKMAGVRMTEMGGKIATEIRFSAEASQYIVPFFSRRGN
jgi:hypothetical protein